MSRAEEIAQQIARSAAWWRDHEPFVRAESAKRESEHFMRVIWDTEYRAKALYEDKLNRAAVRHLGLNVETPPSNPYRPKSYVGCERVIDESGRLVWRTKGDPTPAAEYREGVASTIRAYERAAAEAEFAAHAEAESGMQLSESEFQKKKKADRLIRTQSYAIAKRLTEAGVTAFREDNFKLFTYWIHSNTCEELPHYRRICLIPYIAAMVRAPKLAALEYFLQSNPFARFWTFTTGARCTMEEVPARMTWLFKKLRELNKILRKRWGIQMVFRTTEFGKLEARETGKNGEDVYSENGDIEHDSEGRPLFHPHAHCVMVLRWGAIPKAEWAKMIAFVNAFWSVKVKVPVESKRRPGTFLKRMATVRRRIYWNAGKLIESARECCKYVTKPGDVLKLSKADLAEFFNVLGRRRLVRPMGILADEIRARREAGRTLRRKRIGRRLVWAEVLNHNRLSLETEAEKAERHEREDAEEAAEMCHEGLKYGPETAGAPKWLETVEAEKNGVKCIGLRLENEGFCARGVANEVTKVMARIGPAAGPTPFKEPRVLVMSNLPSPCMKVVNTHPLVTRLWAQTVEGWEAGRTAAAAINVHTGTLSGEIFQNDLPDFAPSPPRDPICEPFLAFAT